jgi:hypothetical protein
VTIRIDAEPIPTATDVENGPDVHCPTHDHTFSLSAMRAGGLESGTARLEMAVADNAALVQNSRILVKKSLCKARQRRVKSVSWC